jgi:hypothetical protein
VGVSRPEYWVALVNLDIERLGHSQMVVQAPNLPTRTLKVQSYRQLSVKHMPGQTTKFCSPECMAYHASYSPTSRFWSSDTPCSKYIVKWEILVQGSGPKFCNILSRYPVEVTTYSASKQKPKPVSIYLGFAGTVDSS